MTKYPNHLQDAISGKWKQPRKTSAASGGKLGYRRNKSKVNKAEKKTLVSKLQNAEPIKEKVFANPSFIIYYFTG